MRPVLGLLFCLIVLCSGAARGEPLPPRAFTQELARALTTALPSATVTVKSDLELTIRHPNGQSAAVDLTNAYGAYSRDPQRLDELIQAHVLALSRPPGAQANVPAKLDRSRIVPVIKNRQWIVDLHSGLKSRGADQEHLFEDFNNELVVVYAEDSEKRMRYLTTGEDIGVERSALRALAVDNLKRLLPKIEMRTHDDAFSLVSVGGDYEASLLLIDDIWSGGQIKVNGDIVVAVPARDVLLVTGSRNRTGLKAVRAMAAEFAAKGPYGLTDTLFVYRNGRFTKFGR
jgi:uncharacterized protein YtpQ (UPF0354 family)